ncbi:MAG: class II fructose-bisphosphatase [Verrucomicrobiota bacterium]
MHHVERMIEFEFVRATENAALTAIHWLGRGEKEKGDAAACDAIYGVFDLMNIRGEVVIGEGIKDDAPGIFLGEKLGTWRAGSPKFDIALDPIDGTTNLSKGLPNSISVIAAAQVPDEFDHVMKNITSFYCHKMAYGPAVVKALKKGLFTHIDLDTPIKDVLKLVAEATGKRIHEVVVCVLDRPRNKKFVDEIRAEGAALRMISDGDITAAVAPALPDSGADLYVGIGGTPEGILAAAALKCLGGEIQMRVWPRDEEEAKAIKKTMSAKDIKKTYHAEDLVIGDSSIFCATGISDSPLLPGVKLIGNTATTHSILMRAHSRTVRYIRAVHNFDHKTIRLRSDRKEHALTT